MFGANDPHNPLTLPPDREPIADRIRALYKEEWDMWKSHYKKYFKIAARVLGIGFLLGFIYFTVRPDQEKQALSVVLKAFQDIPFDASAPVLALTLLYHNARASFFAAATGVIPFLCLPLFDPLLNGAVLGLLVSIARHQGLNVPLLILTRIVPHGIIEIPAILYVTSIGMYVSTTLGKRILVSCRRKKSKEKDTDDGSSQVYPSEAVPGFQEIAGDAIRSFLLVVLPLLLIAAFIEAFITPYIN
jgi:stage II sporulation protein M